MRKAYHEKLGCKNVRERWESIFVSRGMPKSLFLALLCATFFFDFWTPRFPAIFIRDHVGPGPDGLGCGIFTKEKNTDERSDTTRPNTRQQYNPRHDNTTRRCDKTRRRQYHGGPRARPGKIDHDTTHDTRHNTSRQHHAR